MGCCAVAKDYRRPVINDSQKRTKKKRLTVACPICEQFYDTDEHKPYLICSNQHQICMACNISIQARNHTKKQVFKCPFCNQIVNQDMIGTDKSVFKYLEKEEKVLRVLPEDRKKLYAFTSIYLPKLHKLMEKDTMKKREESELETIGVLYINGRMLRDMQVLQMDTFKCLPHLRNLQMNNNHILALDSTNYLQDTLLCLDLTNNMISAMKSLLIDGALCFKHLKVLILKQNIIQQIGGLEMLPYLQLLDLSANRIKSMKNIQFAINLRHLNLELNFIEQILYFPFFVNLYSLQLFDNPTRNWEKMLTLQYSRELRVLSASPGKHSSQLTPSSSHIQRKGFLSDQIIKQAKQLNRHLQLILLEVLENVEEEHNIQQKVNPRVVKVYSRTYQTEILNEKSELLNQMKALKDYQPFGSNINFKAASFNKQAYCFQERLWRYVKLNSSQDPADFLYSNKNILCSQKSTCFVSLRSKSSQLSLGVCEFMAGQCHTIQYDFDALCLRGSAVQRIKQQENTPDMHVNREGNKQTNEKQRSELKKIQYRKDLQDAEQEISNKNSKASSQNDTNSRMSKLEQNINKESKLSSAHNSDIKKKTNKIDQNQVSRLSVIPQVRPIIQHSRVNISVSADSSNHTQNDPRISVSNRLSNQGNYHLSQQGSNNHSSHQGSNNPASSQGSNVGNLYPSVGVRESERMGKGEQREYTISLDLKDLKLRVLVDGQQWSNLDLDQKDLWKQYRFFINLKEKSSYADITLNLNNPI